MSKIKSDSPNLSNVLGAVSSVAPAGRREGPGEAARAAAPAHVEAFEPPMVRVVTPFDAAKSLSAESAVSSAEPRSVSAGMVAVRLAQNRRQGVRQKALNEVENGVALSPTQIELLRTVADVGDVGRQIMGRFPPDG